MICFADKCVCADKIRKVENTVEKIQIMLDTV